MEHSIGDYMSKNFNSFNSFNVTNVTDERSQILTWVSSLESWKRHRDLSDARVEEVGDWVLKTPEFQKWRDGDNGGSDEKVLLCSGIPGAGKTFICSLVIDNLCDSTAVPSVGVACLYCDYGGSEEQTPVSMISSLLRQFVTGMPEIPQELAKAFRTAKGQLGGRALTVEKIIDLLSEVLESFDRTYICVDALDEFRARDRTMFLQLLKKIIDKSPNTRLFLTGRLHIRSELDKQFGSTVATLTVQPRYDDIRQYLTTKLDNDLGDGDMNDKLREEIVTHIAMKDSEIFLLVALHIDAILGEITIAGRREKLYQIGNDLSDAYGATIERIKAQPKERSRSGMAALMWISLAERPLSIGELCYALAVRASTRGLDPEQVPSIQSILGCCLGLVRVDRETSTVRLIHATLQEYLQSQQDIFESPHTTIAEVCLSYLGFESVQELSMRLQKSSSEALTTSEYISETILFLESVTASLPLLEYASYYWGIHAQKGLTASIEQRAIDLLNQYPEFVAAKIFLNKIGFLLCWNCDSNGSSGLHYASWTGIYKIVAALLRTGSYRVNQKDASGCTPLSLAAQNGHGEVVGVLLGHPDVSPDIADENDRTPLSWAAERGHEGVVKLLLNQADVNPDLTDEDGRTPLAWAAMYGYEAAVALLLSRTDVKPDLADKHGRTPLSWAAERGREGVINLLLDRPDINPNSIDSEYGQTPLSLAAERGYGGVVKILLGRANINPDLADSSHRTPLFWALERGFGAVVKLLLDRADVSPILADSSGQTVFHWAAKSGCHGVVRSLLERGDSYPDVSDIYLRTPLSWAAGNGCLEVIKLLLNWTDVDPDSADVYGRTPLSWAAGAGHEEVVPLLLGRGDVSGDAIDIYGQTPLFRAAEHGHKGSVGLLLNRGDVNPERLDNNGRTVLSWAAKNGKEEVVKMLLEWTDICPDLPDHQGRTALSWAAGEGYREVVELLLTRADVNAECVDSEGRSALHWALKNSHEGVAAALQEWACRSEGGGDIAKSAP